MNWPRPTLSQLTILGPQYGANVSAVHSSGGPLRYVRITDIDDWGRLREDSRVEPDSDDVGDYVLEDGDLLLARSGATVGKSYLYSVDDGPCAFAGYLIRFRPDRRLIEPKYLAYYFQTNEYWSWIETRKRVAAQPNVNGSEYASLRLPVASLSEQRRIVEILDEAERLRRLRAEADGKTESILPAVLVNTLGAPGTWISDGRTCPLGELVDVVSGGTPSKGEGRFWSGDVPWVSPKDMKQDFIWDTQDHISDTAVDDSNLKVVQPGAVLVVVRGMILARTVPVSLVRRSVTINQDLKALLPKSPKISGEYLWALLHVASRRLLSEVRTAAHGTRKLDTPDLQQFRVPIPSEIQLSLVTSAVQRHEELVDKRSRARERITSLFTILLAQAFDGRLTAQWRESRMTELIEEIREQARLLAEAPQPC